MPRPLPSYILIFATGLLIPTGQVVADSFVPTIAQAEVDNTERNDRDRNGTTLTPQDQEEGEGDRELTAAVRRAIVDDDSLSLNAHNVKIISHKGTVTLRGPVEDAAEKTKLQTIAQNIRGVEQVDNQLEPKTP